MSTRALMLVCLGLTIGCSDSDSHSDHHEDAAMLAVDSGAVVDAAPSVDTGTTGVGTPILVSASLVVHGTMALAWQNPASTCSSLMINRKKDAGTYAVAQTLTGQATSVQDMPGHTAGTYCYTVTCTLNGQASPPSNEKCVTQ